MNAQCSLREVYTVHVNSYSAISPDTQTNFTSYIDIPLRNVIKAELLMASIAPTTNTEPIVHLYIPELVSKFNLRGASKTTITGSGLVTPIGKDTAAQSNVGLINNSFATLPFDSASFLNATVGRIYYNKNSNFPVEVNYIEPIRQINKLTIQVYNPDGSIVTPNGNSYFTFRFECSKDNVCLY